MSKRKKASLGSIVNLSDRERVVWASETLKATLDKAKLEGEDGASAYLSLGFLTGLAALHLKTEGKLEDAAP